MRKLFIAATCVALLGSTAMLVAQAPYAPPGHAHNNVIVYDAIHPSNPTGILPQEFKEIYGFNRIPNQGQGMTIALVDAYKDPNITSDLAFYASYFHKTPCNFQVVIVGNPIEGQGWDLEESLDTQQACALAPQANIILFEANSDSFSDLLTAVQMASQAPYNASVISMSWGGGEFEGENDYDSYFCNIVNGAGQPVTNVAATGDGGHGTIYPSVSPCVVAAGGTTVFPLTAAPLSSPLSLDYGSEQGWRDSGGGVSCYSGADGPCAGGGEPEPSWQVNACAPYSPAGSRCVPDIASDANPGTGVPVYDTYSYGGWVQVGGTSVATPDWGSFFTLVNSQRALNSGNPQNTLSQADPDIYNIAYNSSTYATDLNQVPTGPGNGTCGLLCDDEPGYNLVTGWGSYQAQNLWAALVAATD
jgi:subtilase family serine protease